MIEVLSPGPLASVQDLGRPGFAALGVPRSGAFDRAAAMRANRIVGNDPDAALIETTLGGLELRLRDAATIALCGTACPGLDVDVAVSLPAGSRVRLGTPATGLRSYLAVRGGLAVEPTLGSASSDLLSGLGPPALRHGDRLTIGPRPPRLPSGATAVGAPSRERVRVLPGPRVDWLVPGALDRFAGTGWTVRPDSDRIGIRLAGTAIGRARDAELPSEPTLPGSVQIPADGRPIVFGPDAPVTGGYPVLAIVLEADLGLLAHVRPGDTVRFEVARGPIL